MYKWYIILPGLLLILTPKKDRALSAISIFLGSYAFRQWIRMSVAETRPIFNEPSIIERGCSCSFGMPSGHSEGIVMTYSLLAYCTLPSKPSLKRIIITSSIVAFVSFNVFLARIYYGKHSLHQVLLGGCQGLLFFSLFLAFEDTINRFHRQLVSRKIFETLVGYTCLSSLAIV